MHEPEMSFNRKAVKPMQCLRDGWRLIKDDYWLFLGITFVGVLVGSMGPFGMLIGPFLCGIHMCLLNQESGRPVSFNLLFKGFDYFVPSLVATLLMVGPLFVVLIVMYIGFAAALFGLVIAFAPAQGRGGGQPPTEFFAGMVALWAVMIILILVFSVLMQILFMFIYPLIVDRKLSGVDSVRMSIRAARANFVGLLGLVLLFMVMGIVGVLACYVGAIFVMPLQYAMIAVAYRQVFPERERFAEFRDDPDPDDEPEPAILVHANPGIQSGEGRPSNSVASPPDTSP